LVNFFLFSYKKEKYFSEVSVTQCKLVFTAEVARAPAKIFPLPPTIEGAPVRVRIPFKQEDSLESCQPEKAGLHDVLRWLQVSPTVYIVSLKPIWVYYIFI